MRHDDGHMAALGDHRVGAIRVALRRPLTRVRMHVSKHAHLAGTAKLPQRNKPLAVKDDDSSIQCGGIEVVIADKVRDFSRATSEDKRAAFPASASSAVQLTYEPPPNEPRNAQTRRRHISFDSGMSERSRDRRRSCCSVAT